MTKLDYSLSLRAKGLGSKEISQLMKEKGFDDSEIEYYLKKSDDIFMSQSLQFKGRKPKRKSKNALKLITLILSLLLLTLVFFGYARLGLIGLFIVWSLIGYSSYKR